MLTSVRRMNWLFVVLVGLIPGLLLGADPTQEEVENQLDRSVSLDKGIVRAPLKNTLEYLADRYDLKIEMDRAAFKKQLKVENIGEQAVCLPKVVGVSLRLVLQLLAKEVEGTYEIKDNIIRIVPRSKTLKVVKRRSEELEKAEKQIREKLEKKVTLKNGIEDTTIEDALEYLSDLWDLTMILDSHAFRKAAKGKAIEGARVSLPPQHEVALEKILRKLLKQIRANYEITEMAILVIPAKNKEEA